MTFFPAGNLYILYPILVEGIRKLISFYYFCGISLFKKYTSEYEKLVWLYGLFLNGNFLNHVSPLKH